MPIPPARCSYRLRNLVDDSADLARRAAGLSRRLRAGHADAVPADRDADFLWGAIFRLGAAGAADTIAGYTYSRDDRLLPADADQPGVFQHAGPGLGHRAADPQRRDQEVPDPAGRPDRLSAAQPHRPQAGVLRRGGRAVCAGVLSVPRLFRRLARRRRRCWPSWRRW